MDARQFQFEWDEIKEAANMRKHGVSFEFAPTVFSDPQLLTIADLEHSESEERSRLACPATALCFSIVYVCSDGDSTTTKIRFISARKATQTEILQYEEAP